MSWENRIAVDPKVLVGKPIIKGTRAILARSFNSFLQIGRLFDRFHYSAYYCSNAMAQLGGYYWKKFFPVMSKCLLDAQSEAGPWNAESGLDSTFGPCYPTAISVLSLTPAYQLLPIYQR